MGTLVCANVEDILRNLETFLLAPNAARNFMNDVVASLGSSTIEKLQSEWRKLEKDENELFLKRVRFVENLAKQTLETMESSQS